MVVRNDLIWQSKLMSWYEVWWKSCFGGGVVFRCGSVEAEACWLQKCVLCWCSRAMIGWTSFTCLLGSLLVTVAVEKSVMWVCRFLYSHNVIAKNSCLSFKCCVVWSFLSLTVARSRGECTCDYTPAQGFLWAILRLTVLKEFHDVTVLPNHI